MNNYTFLIDNLASDLKWFINIGDRGKDNVIDAFIKYYINDSQSLEDLSIDLGLPISDVKRMFSYYIK